MKTRCSYILLLIIFATITVIYFFMVTNAHKDRITFQNTLKESGLPSNLSVFSVVMSPEEKQILLNMVTVLISQMELANLTYILYGGSLLGVYRHAGFIPWDDDVDIWINNSQSELLKDELNKVEGYKLYSEPNSQWKFFSICGEKVENKSYNWPFIDILRYNENNTHVWDSLEQYKALFIYKKSDVFPLKKCKFENLYLNVPNHTEKVLTTNYDPEICSSAKFDHKTNLPIRKQRQVIPCKQLSAYYQFGSYCI